MTSKAKSRSAKARTDKLRRQEHAELMAVSGALCDAGDVPVEPYADGVRLLTKQRNELRVELASAVRDAKIYRAQVDALAANLSKVEAREAKIREAMERIQVRLDRSKQDGDRHQTLRLLVQGELDYAIAPDSAWGVHFHRVGQITQVQTGWLWGPSRPWEGSEDDARKLAEEMNGLEVSKRKGWRYEARPLPCPDACRFCGQPRDVHRGNRRCPNGETFFWPVGEPGGG